MRFREKCQADGRHGELDAVISAGFAHEPADVGLDRALIDSKLGRDFTIRPGHENQFKNLPLAHGELRLRCQSGLRHFEQAVNELGE